MSRVVRFSRCTIDFNVRAQSVLWMNPRFRHLSINIHSVHYRFARIFHENSTYHIYSKLRYHVIQLSSFCYTFIFPSYFSRNTAKEIHFDRSKDPDTKEKYSYCIFLLYVLSTFVRLWFQWSVICRSKREEVRYLGRLSICSAKRGRISASTMLLSRENEIILLFLVAFLVLREFLADRKIIGSYWIVMNFYWQQSFLTVLHLD